MQSFKDKLRAFKEANKDSLRDAEVPTKAVTKQPASKREYSEVVEEEVELSDEELFLEALENTSKGEAIMRKYERTELEAPTSREPGAEEDDSSAEKKKDVRDQSLFLQWVGDFETPPQK